MRNKKLPPGSFFRRRGQRKVICACGVIFALRVSDMCPLGTLRWIFLPEDLLFCHGIITSKTPCHSEEAKPTKNLRTPPRFTASGSLGCCVKKHTFERRDRDLKRRRCFKNGFPNRGCKGETARQFNRQIAEIAAISARVISFNETFSETAGTWMNPARTDVPAKRCSSAYRRSLHT